MGTGTDRKRRAATSKEKNHAKRRWSRSDGSRRRQGTRSRRQKARSYGELISRETQRPLRLPTVRADRATCTPGALFRAQMSEVWHRHASAMTNNLSERICASACMTSSPTSRMHDRGCPEDTRRSWSGSEQRAAWRQKPRCIRGTRRWKLNHPEMCTGEGDGSMPGRRTRRQ